MEACTSYPLPRYFPIVFALAGDSTITSDLLIFILISGTRYRTPLTSSRLLLSSWTTAGSNQLRQVALIVALVCAEIRQNRGPANPGPPEFQKCPTETGR